MHTSEILHNPKEKGISISKPDKLISENPFSFIIFLSDAKKTKHRIAFLTFSLYRWNFALM